MKPIKQVYMAIFLAAIILTSSCKNTQLTSPEQVAEGLRAPSNVHIQGLSETELKLTWDDNSTNETGFVIERRAGSSSNDFVEIVTLDKNSTSYIDSDLSESDEFYYRLKAVISDKNAASEYSHVVRARLTDGLLLDTFSGHRGAVKALAYSSAGLRLVSASADCTLILWDGKTGEILSHMKGHGYSVNGVIFNVTGSLIASYGWIGDVIIWDGYSGKLMNRISPAWGHPKSICFNWSGSKIAVGLSNSYLPIYDTQNGDLIKNLTLDYQSSPGIGSIDYADREVSNLMGDKIIAFYYYDEVKLWDVETATILWNILLPEGGECAVAFLPDKKFVLIHKTKGKIEIRSTSSGKILEELSDTVRPCSSYTGFALNQDRTKLAVCCGNNVEIWNLELNQRRILFNIRQPGYVMAVAFKPGENIIAVGNGEKINIIELKSYWQEVE